MNGIDIIKEKILQEAQIEADEVLSQAKKDAESLLLAAGKDAEKKVQDILERGERQAKVNKDRIISSASMEKRKAVLAAKQEVLDEVFEAVKAKITGLSGSEYEDFLVKLICESSSTKKEEVLFPEADGDIAQSVVNKVNEKLGGSLVVSAGTASFGKGVLLRDGSVEVNCSLASIADYRREELTQEIAEYLFNQN